jgi:hypothetical protein
VHLSEEHEKIPEPQNSRNWKAWEREREKKRRREERWMDVVVRRRKMCE